MRNMNKKLLKIILGVLGVIAVGVGLFFLIRAINAKKTDQPKTALVVYFTEVTAQDGAEFVDMGETEIVAQEIAIQANANVFRIQQIDWYSENHEENMEHAKKEKEENARPEYLEDLVDTSYYSTVFLGYPVWYEDLPMVVYSFIEKTDWGGKDLYLFNTYDGKIVDTRSKVAEALGGGVAIGENVLSLSNDEARSETAVTKIQDWLKEIGIKK